MHNFIQVRYRYNREGLASDVTINELILSNQIKQFYRPSEHRWVDVDYDSIRVKSITYHGLERREAKKAAKKEEPVGLISKPMNAQEWFEKGFSIMYMTSNHQEAIQAFSSSIELDPANARAYLNRGMTYERINNSKQAIADYSRAIELASKDAKAYYVRGVLYWRLGKYREAARDIELSADLGYKPAGDFLKLNPNLGRLCSNSILYR